jgi:hypothetical protein
MVGLFWVNRSGREADRSFPSTAEVNNEWSKGKHKGLEGSRGGWRYSCTHSWPRHLEGVGYQHHAPAALPLGKTRYPWYRRLGGPQGRSGRVHLNLDTWNKLPFTVSELTQSNVWLSYPTQWTESRTQSHTRCQVTLPSFTFQHQTELTIVVSAYEVMWIFRLWSACCDIVKCGRGVLMPRENLQHPIALHQTCTLLLNTRRATQHSIWRHDTSLQSTMTNVQNQSNHNFQLPGEQNQMFRRQRQFPLTF